MKRIILLLDMDAFFPAIEQRENPRFLGLPVVVCTSTPLSIHPSKDVVVIPEEGDSNQSANHPERAKRVEGWRADPKDGIGRGVVSSASYEARKYGIHSAMPISKAFRLCPKAIFLPVNGEFYHKVSKNIMQILQRYTLVIEQVSVDEAYLDIRFTESFTTATTLAEKMRKEIF